MLITVDTREQRPYCFKGIPSSITYECRREALPTGDYMSSRAAPGESDSFASQAIVERKTLADLYSTASQGRRRFEAELLRMQKYGYAALIIEAQWTEIFAPNDTLRHATGMKPKAMLASLLAWSTRHRLHVHALPGRRAAELVTFRILERWFRDGLPDSRLGGK